MKYLFFLLAGCGAPCPTYEEIAPIIERSCLPCHSVNVRGANRQAAPRDIDYDTEEDVREHAESIKLRLDDMPPASSSAPRLSPADKAALRCL